MTESLILDSLEIQQFRAFRHLQIERLGRINLITGKNNVGKSCLLESLALYAGRGSLLVMQNLLDARDESSRLLARDAADVGDRAARHLFYGREGLEEQSEPIQIGPIGSSDDTLSIAVVWFAEQADRQTGQRQLRLLPPNARNTVGPLVPGLSIRMGAKQLLSYPLEIDIGDISRITRAKPSVKEIRSVFVTADGLSKAQVSQLWDSIALTDQEQEVLASLRIINPEVERVTLVVSREGGQKRIPIAKMMQAKDPIPLRSLGEGMNRLFGLALALVNAQDGLLLIDEVESGLHYSVHQDLWRLICRSARQLNVQVFATTHSWDCIEGFQKATQGEAHEDTQLIRLESKPDQIVATLFDERELRIATREQIEVR